MTEWNNGKVITAMTLLICRATPPVKNAVKFNLPLYSFFYSYLYFKAKGV